MNVHRLMATAVTCAAGLSATACTAGVTSVGPATPASPATSRTASSPAGSPSPTGPASPARSASAGPGDTVSLNAPIGSFPIPHGAQVLGNMPCGKEIIIQMVSVAPAQASAFYMSALPRAGYKITDESMSSDPNTGAPQGVAQISFTGHGYTGLMTAFANLGPQPSASVHISLPSSLTKNAVSIVLFPAGTAPTPTCPG